MRFEEIIGQNEIKKKLHHFITEGRIPHALLFAGPEGSGKYALALAFAQRICCEAPLGMESCGTCPSCLKYNKLEHPDLHFVFPVVKAGSTKAVADTYVKQWREYVLNTPYVSGNGWAGKVGAENKIPLIYTEESEVIIRKLSMKSYESEYKIMIIYLPERMHNKASNKLLKMIEEPPPKTLFMLVSENPEDIITTILSRCQRINIPSIDAASMQQAIKKRHRLNDEEIQEVVRIARGNYVLALETIRSSAENNFFHENFVMMMRLAYGRKLNELKKWSDDMHKIGRDRQKNFLQYAQRMVRENFMLNFKDPELNYLSRKELEFSEKFSRFINESNVISIMEELELAEQHIEQNVYGKMVLFDMSLKMILLLKS